MRSRFAAEHEVIVPRSLKQLLATEVPEDARKRRPRKVVALRRAA
jgi:hypothetical protein